MRAAFLDAQGPRIWRIVPYAFPLALLVSTLFLPVAGPTAGIVAVAALAALCAVGLLPLRQRRQRTVEVVCGPGYIDVLRAGTRTQRILAKSIVGATTARTKSGILFTISHKKRDEPILVEVENDAEADRVRHALGIGHGGFGTIAWASALGSSAKAAFVGRTIGSIFGLATVALGVAFGATAGLLFAGSLSPLIVLALILSMVGWLAGHAEPSIIMHADGLRLATTRGWFVLPYAQVLGVSHENGNIVFQVPPPWFRVEVPAGPGLFGPGLSPADRDALVAQIGTAAARARGEGPQKNDPTGRLDALRRNGESARDWLVRLDMAGQMLASSPGYRGNTLDAEDLWAILEDPDAESELRAAAARVLRHSAQPDTRVRIDAAVAAVREDRVNRKLRIAIADDLDAAAREMTMLEAEEMRSHLPPHMRFAQVSR